MKKREKGFTLFELLLVFTIFSILSSLSSVGVKAWVAKSRLDSEVKELYFTFLKARQLAINMQEGYGLCFDEEAGEYTLFSNSGGDLETKKLRDGVSYQEITFGENAKMVFKPLGTAEGGHIILTNETGCKYEVVVSGTTGRVRYERLQGDN